MVVLLFWACECTREGWPVDCYWLSVVVPLSPSSYVRKTKYLRVAHIIVSNPHKQLLIHNTYTNLHYNFTQNTCVIQIPSEELLFREININYPNSKPRKPLCETSYLKPNDTASLCRDTESRHTPHNKVTIYIIYNCPDSTKALRAAAASLAALLLGLSELSIPGDTGSLSSRSWCSSNG